MFHFGSRFDSCSQVPDSTYDDSNASRRRGVACHHRREKEQQIETTENIILFDALFENKLLILSSKIHQESRQDRESVETRCTFSPPTTRASSSRTYSLSYRVIIIRRRDSASLHCALTALPVRHDTTPAKAMVNHQICSIFFERVAKIANGKGIVCANGFLLQIHHPWYNPSMSTMGVRWNHRHA